MAGGQRHVSRADAGAVRTRRENKGVVPEPVTLAAGSSRLPALRRQVFRVDTEPVGSHLRFRSDIEAATRRLLTAFSASAR